MYFELTSISIFRNFSCKFSKLLLYFLVRRNEYSRSGIMVVFVSRDVPGITMNSTSGIMLS